VLSSRAHLGTWKVGVVLLAVVIIAAQGSSSALLLALTAGAAYAIAAVGMDLMTGYAGQPTLGQGAFMAVGAYASTAMMINYGWSFLPAVGFALALAAVIAVLLGLGALRLAHIGTAIVTFSFAFVVFMLLNGDLLKTWTGQATGLVVPAGTILGLDLYDERTCFYVAIAMLVVVTALTYAYAHSRHGRVLMAVKRSEILPAVLGVNVFTVKLVAMVWSSVVGALGGVILVQASGFTTPELFATTLSITLLAVSAIGGLGTLVGPAAGAFVYSWLGYAGAGVSGSGMWWPLAFLAVLIFSPAGMYGLVGSAASTVVRTVRRRTSTATEVTEATAGPNDEQADAPAQRWQQPSDVRALPAETEPVLEVRDLTLRYGGVTALDKVTFTVARGRIHALVGPNGAGKTSLLDVLMGVTSATGGDVLLDGVSVLGDPPHRRARKGLSRSFQHATLVPDLTVFQNVQLAAENGAARRRGADVRAATAAALTMAGVPERLWHRPSDELNGGDQKLVDIARAFVGRPKVILLDEPTSGVTEAEIDGIASAIYAACREGITLLVIDHNIEFVRAIAHRVTVLDFGRVIGDGEPARVLNSREVVQAFLGGGNSDPADSRN